MTTPALDHFLVLHNGHRIPVLGFGTWQSETNDVGAAVEAAVRSGFRHIDCARVYGNEAEIGAVLHHLFSSGVVKREDLFITSKVWNTDRRPETAMAAAKQSVKDLQCGYLDLCLVHWPISWKHNGTELFPESDAGGHQEDPLSVVQMWRGMEPIVDAGLAKSIGVSNFNENQVKEVLAAARIKPTVNQIEVHPALPQKALRALHASVGIVTQAYCPLAIAMGKKLEDGLVGCPQIQRIAKEAGLAPVDMLLRWNLQVGNVVLSKSVKPERIAQNAATAFGGLDNATMAKLEQFGVEHPTRVCNPTSFFSAAAPFFNDPCLPDDFSACHK